MKNRKINYDKYDKLYEYLKHNLQVCSMDGIHYEVDLQRIELNYENNSDKEILDLIFDFTAENVIK